MAETAVSYLVDKLIALLTDEVNLLRGVHGEVSEIKTELVFIRAFLKDADKKAEVEGDISDGVKEWVEEIREVAFKIEDIYHMTINRPDPHGFIAFLHKMACFVTKLKLQRHIATQIREINGTVRGIKKRSTRYGFDSLQQTPMNDAPEQWFNLFGLSFVNNTELFSFDRARGIKIQRIEYFKHLQKLYCIEANIDGACIIEELGALTQLRTLGVMKVRSRDGKSLCGCIEKMKYLESLMVRSISEDERLDLDSISHPPEFLRRLYLRGRLMTLPRWIMKLQNLAKIVIRWSKLGDDPLKVLGNLPELVELDIGVDAFVGEQLHFAEGVFPKLKVLGLRDLKWLSSLVIEEGALRALEKLYLSYRSACGTICLFLLC